MTINLQILQQIYNYNLKFSLIDIDFGKLCVYFIKMTFFDMLSTVLSWAIFYNRISAAQPIRFNSYKSGASKGLVSQSYSNNNEQ